MKTFKEFMNQKAYASALEDQSNFELDEQDDPKLADKIGQGIFTVDFINKVLEIQDLDEAKELAMERIEDSDAKEVNKNKARAMVKNAKSVRSLAIDMSNFSLKHQKFGVVK